MIEYPAGSLDTVARPRTREDGSRTGLLRTGSVQKDLRPFRKFSNRRTAVRDSPWDEIVNCEVSMAKPPIKDMLARSPLQTSRANMIRQMLSGPHRNLAEAYT